MIKNRSGNVYHDMSGIYTNYITAEESRLNEMTLVTSLTGWKLFYTPSHP
jgi:hypothetical protein